MTAAALREQFDRFDRTNPLVWEQFVACTKWAIDRGLRHYSADAVLHRVRWAVNIDTVNAGSIDGVPLKVNDHFSAFYSRRWTEQYPQYRDFFRLRKSKADQQELRLVG